MEDLIMSNDISILLDKIATSLEEKGLLKEARDIDIIANTVDRLASSANDLVLYDKFIYNRDKKMSYARSHGRAKTMGWLVDLTSSLDIAKKFKDKKEAEQFIKESYHGDDLVPVTVNEAKKLEAKVKGNAKDEGSEKMDLNKMNLFHGTGVEAYDIDEKPLRVKIKGNDVIKADSMVLINQLKRDISKALSYLGASAYHVDTNNYDQETDRTKKFVDDLKKELDKVKAKSRSDKNLFNGIRVDSWKPGEFYDLSKIYKMCEEAVNRSKGYANNKPSVAARDLLDLIAESYDKA
jgi:hypothetical protein